jgi:hypothetical protein
MRRRIVALTVGLVIVLGAVVVIIFGLRYQRAGLWDFGLSLSTEVVGAFLTLISIEVIFQLGTAWREEQKRLPAKCMLYARLMHKIDEFLVSVLPMDHYQVTGSVYIASGKSYQVVSVPILDQVNDQWSVGLEQSIQDCVYFDLDLLTQAALWLDGILNHAGAFSEPELTRRMVLLRQELRESISSLRSIDWEEEQSRAAFVRSLRETVSATLEVRGWLQKVLRKHFVVADESYFDAL